jgi:lipoprotein-releasing system ATP-binding protein
MIKIEDIRKSFGNLQVLKGISLEIGKSEVVSIVGSSGAGKTTLLQIVGTLDKADSGKIIIAGEDVTEFSSDRMARFRNKHISNIHFYDFLSLNAMVLYQYY